MILLYQFSLPHLIHFSLEGWENVLFEPVAPSFSDGELTKCQRERQQARLDMAPGRFVPRCRDDGSYEDIQCRGAVCYCVDANGDEISATRTLRPGTPNCAVVTPDETLPGRTAPRSDADCWFGKNCAHSRANSRIHAHTNSLIHAHTGSLVTHSLTPSLAYSITRSFVCLKPRCDTWLTYHSLTHSWKHACP